MSTMPDHTASVSPDRAREVVSDAVLRIVPDADLAAIADDVDLRDELELDSLDFLGLVEQVCTQLGRRIDEEDYGRLRSMQDWVDFLAPGA